MGRRARNAHALVSTPPSFPDHAIETDLPTCMQREMDRLSRRRRREQRGRSAKSGAGRAFPAAAEEAGTETALARVAASRRRLHGRLRVLALVRAPRLVIRLEASLLFYISLSVPTASLKTANPPALKGELQSRNRQYVNSKQLEYPPRLSPASCLFFFCVPLQRAAEGTSSFSCAVVAGTAGLT